MQAQTEHVVIAVLSRPSPLTGLRYNCPGQSRYALNIHRQVRGQAEALHIEPG